MAAGEYSAGMRRQTQVRRTFGKEHTFQRKSPPLKKENEKSAVPPGALVED